MWPSRHSSIPALAVPTPIAAKPTATRTATVRWATRRTIFSPESSCVEFREPDSLSALIATIRVNGVLRASRHDLPNCSARAGPVPGLADDEDSALVESPGHRALEPRIASLLGSRNTKARAAGSPGFKLQRAPTAAGPRREARQGRPTRPRPPGGFRFRGSQARTSTYAGCGLPGQVRRPGNPEARALVKLDRHAR
jgi:hypothetical protein